MGKKNKQPINQEYVTQNAKNIDSNDIKKLSNKRKRFNKILKLKVFIKQKQKLKLLFEILQQYRKGYYKNIPWRTVTSITFTLLYIINPLDLIPDVLPVVGYVDDISVYMALMKLVDDDIRDYEKWKASQNPEILSS